MSNARCVRAVVSTVALASFACACGGGRAFKTPKSLSDARAPRTVTAPPAEMADEPFRAESPALGAPAKPRLATPTESRLSNGIRVVMLERHDFPSISAVLVLDRGSAAAAPGVAALYAESLTGTSSEYKSGEAWQYLNFVGASVDGEAWRDATVLQISAVTPLFVSALSRAAPMFLAPALDSDEVDDARTQIAARQTRESDDPADVAHDALYASLFPAPHPYGVPIAGERGKTTPVPHATLAAFRDGHLSADHVSVVCVGDFKPAAMQATLERALGKLPKRTTIAPLPFPDVPKHVRKVVVIDRPGAAQSSVAIGWPGPRAADRDVAALEVLAAATAGELSTRLNISVRKELGATYGVRMRASGLRDGGTIRISAAIDTPRTAEALRGLFAELERLRTEPLSPTELTAAKLRTYHDLEHGSTGGLARYLARAVAEGLPPAHVVAHNARVDVTSAEDVRLVADRWLAPDETRLIVVGDAQRIVEGLRALHLGEVTVSRGR